MTQMFETDIQGRTLIAGGWKADLYASDEDYEVLEHTGLNGTEALRLYNEINGTRLEPSFFDSWLKRYGELAKNPLTGTRVGVDHPAYHQYRQSDSRVREYMRTHKDVVEEIRVKNGL